MVQRSSMQKILDAAFAALLAACLFLGMASAFAAAEAGEREKVSDEDRTLATVNGEPVTEVQVLRRLKAVDPDVELNRDTPNRWARLMESATEAEIRDRLLLQAARAEGLEISPEDIDSALVRSKELLGADSYAKMLAERQASEADYRAFLSDRMLIDKYRFRIVGDLEVDEATLRDYYRGHRDSFQAPARVRLEVVELTDAGLAERIAERLREGEALAAVEDPDAGVRITEKWIHLRSLPLALREQVENAAAKDVLGPQRAEEKIRVIRVVERQASRRLSYQESKGLIQARLLESRRQAALDDWYDRAKRRAQIEYP